MAVQTDDEPKDRRRPALAVIVLGLAIGIISSVGAFLFTYEGLGPGPDDPYGRGGVTSLIVLGMIFAFALLYIGGATYLSERRADE